VPYTIVRNASHGMRGFGIIVRETDDRHRKYEYMYMMEYQQWQNYVTGMRMHNRTQNLESDLC
jgi:transcription initiation factor IIE alpha subunit